MNLFSLSISLARTKVTIRAIEIIHAWSYLALSYLSCSIFTVQWLHSLLDVIEYEMIPRACLGRLRPELRGMFNCALQRAALSLGRVVSNPGSSGVIVSSNEFLSFRGKCQAWI